MWEFVWIGVSYLLGALPFGVIIAKTVKGIDPRTAGSCNPGTTNVARLCGFSWGVVTLACDILKGAVPVFVALYLSPSGFYHSVVALAAVAGHLRSPFLGFKGGKGVATSIGVLIPLGILPLLCAVLPCVVVIARSSYVSLGALTLVTLLPFAYALFGRFDLIPLALVMLGLVFWTHRANIDRLARGEEKSFRRSAPSCNLAEKPLQAEGN